MTLAEIMRLALRQLDEDPADISEFADLFRNYANLGYQILVSQYYKPKDTIMLSTNEKGEAYIDGLGIDSIISLTDDYGTAVGYIMSSDGSSIKTPRQDAHLKAVCVVEYPMMQEDTEEPRIPEYAHYALVDYICFRYLSIGNAAKQSRAMLFYQQFERTARTIKPQGSGSVKRMRNLYSASSIHNVG
ncbi:MAG: hypothetical protein IJD60_07545 [Clostridia bacterium]|nr:hypothetical protein [Clostridia bacterium]